MQTWPEKILSFIPCRGLSYNWPQQLVLDGKAPIYETPLSEQELKNF